jgi:hypothetical protein
MIVAKDKKQHINASKKAYMVKNGLKRLSDAEYMIELIKFYESNKK